MSLDYEKSDVMGFALFGMPIPIYNGTAFLDPAVWVERTASSGGFSERSVTGTTWVEKGT